MKRLLFIYITLFCCFTTSSSQSDAGQRMPAEKLLSQCELLLSKFEYAQVQETAKKLEKVARQNNNKRLLGFVNYYLAVCDITNGNVKKAFSRLNHAQKTAAELENDSIMALVMNCRGVYEASSQLNMYIAQRYFLRSLEYAKKSKYESVIGRVYSNLSVIAMSQKDTTGIEYAFNCYRIGIQHKNFLNTFIGAYNIASFYNMMGKNKEALKYVKIAADIVEKNKMDDVAALHLLFSKVFCGLGKLKEARAHIQKSLASRTLGQPLAQPEIYYQYARVCYEEKNYQEALVMLEKALEQSKKSSIHMNDVAVYKLMSQCYEKMNDCAKALECMKQANENADKVNTTDKAHLINERQMVYNMAKKEHEVIMNAQKLKSQQRVIFLLVIGLGLLGTLLFIVFKESRRRNKLYKNIVRSNMLAIARENKLRAKISNLAGKEESTVRDTPRVVEEKKRPAAMDSEKAGKIYEELCRLMEDERIYTDAGLNREKLAERLGTNRTYLSQVINEKARQSYYQFVNSYRINEAVRVLSDPKRVDYPLKVLCADLGFSSLSTFYKLFQSAVGMSPASYRKSLIDLEET